MLEDLPLLESELVYHKLFGLDVLDIHSHSINYILHTLVSENKIICKNFHEYGRLKNANK